jgi:hypothetical protein
MGTSSLYSGRQFLPKPEATISSRMQQPVGKIAGVTKFLSEPLDLQEKIANAKTRSTQPLV